MADRITPEERRLIDEHLARHGARRIPRGVGLLEEPAGLHELFMRDYRLSRARRRRARAQARAQAKAERRAR